MDMPTSPGSSGNEDVNEKDKDGRTALIEAAATGNTDRVKSLIAAGADVNAQHNDGQTALMDAALRGNPDCVKALIAAGADVNAKTQGEATALVAACLTWYLQDTEAIHRYEETIEALIAAGADVNAKATDGQTALMYADRGSVAAVKALIAAGADVNAKDNSGLTVLMRMRARPDISAILRAAGATEPPATEPPAPLVSAPIPGPDARFFRTRRLSWLLIILYGSELAYMWLHMEGRSLSVLDWFSIGSNLSVIASALCSLNVKCMNGNSVLWMMIILLALAPANAMWQYMEGRSSLGVPEWLSIGCNLSIIAFVLRGRARLRKLGGS
jgi:hypothetical protein